MRKYVMTLAAALLSTAAIPGMAAAADAVTTVDLNMRAGPSTDFPVVEVLPEEAQVAVHGCVRGYQWCDVTWRNDRGWVYGPYLQQYYSNRYMPLVEYGPAVGVPIIGFSIGTYWDSYYRDRPWYDRRQRWRNVWRDDRRDDRRDRRADRRKDRGEDRADRKDRGDDRADRKDRREDRADRQKDRRQGRADRREDRQERRADGRQDRSEGKRSERRENRMERRQGRIEQRRESRSEGRGGRAERSEQGVTSRGLSGAPQGDRGQGRFQGGGNRGGGDRGDRGGRDGQGRGRGG